MNMSTTAPLFKKDGDQYLCSLTGCLLLAAGAVYGDPRETTPRGRRNGQRLVDAILTAARKAGYTQGDILATLLARNQPSPRIAAMAKTACDLIPEDTKRQVIESLRLEVHGHD